MMGFMCYYGHVQNTSNLGEGNVYKSYFLGALVEIPCWSIPVIIAKLGRRWPLLLLFATSGLAGVLYGFVPQDWPLTSLRQSYTIFSNQTHTKIVQIKHSNIATYQT